MGGRFGDVLGGADAREVLQDAEAQEDETDGDAQDRDAMGDQLVMKVVLQVQESGVDLVRDRTAHGGRHVDHVRVGAATPTCSK